MDCSGEHRGFGVSVSFIKSVTLDQWTEAQFNLMRVGGNQRLQEFLTTNQMPEELDKKDVYSSKLMSYYRRMLKAESKGELFMEPPPPRERWWDPAGDETILFDNNSSYVNNLFTNKTSGYSTNYNNNILTYNNNDYSPPSSFSNNNDSYPKSEIIISDNHYQQAKNYSEIASSFSNKVPSEPKFAKIDPKYQNDSRFASIGSEPISSYSSNSGPTSYLYGIGSILGSVWNTSVSAASAVKEKMNEMEVGSKLLYVGGKTLQAVAYAGGKVLEKGSEIVQSETVHNMVGKAGEGLGYIKEKIVGGRNNDNSVSSDSYHQSMTGDYSARGSNDYDRY